MTKEHKRAYHCVLRQELGGLEGKRRVNENGVRSKGLMKTSGRDRYNRNSEDEEQETLKGPEYD